MAGFLTGLIGAGIGASLSPPLHEREADHTGVRLLYRLIDLDKLGVPASETPALLNSARKLGFTGLNLTHPCKQVVLACLDELSTEAAAIGAVNTVVFQDGKAIGHNTDWLGFATSLERWGVPANDVVLLGAGGAGAAVAYAMTKLGVRRLTVIDVDRERADAVAQRFGVTSAGIEQLARTLADAEGLIHATPIGMASHPGVPFALELLRPDLWVSDLIYGQRDTELLRHAQTIGCPTLAGGPMLVFQAAEAFRLFTGVTPDANRMLAHFVDLTTPTRTAPAYSRGE